MLVKSSPSQGGSILLAQFGVGAVSIRGPGLSNIAQYEGVCWWTCTHAKAGGERQMCPRSVRNVSFRATGISDVPVSLTWDGPDLAPDESHLYDARQCYGQNDHTSRDRHPYGKIRRHRIRLFDALQAILHGQESTYRQETMEACCKRPLQRTCVNSELLLLPH